MVLIREKGGAGDCRGLWGVGTRNRKNLLHIMPISGAWPHMYVYMSVCV